MILEKACQKLSSISETIIKVMSSIEQLYVFVTKTIIFWIYFSTLWPLKSMWPLLCVCVWRSDIVAGSFSRIPSQILSFRTVSHLKCLFIPSKDDTFINKENSPITLKYKVAGF